MPHYDYHCSNCDHSLEVFQKITEEPLGVCPQCKQPTLRRGIGGGGALFRFKGKGFYATDYASKEEPKKSCSCSGEHHCS